ncbi:MAG: gliding motility protein GldG [Myxococcaceae bacterium]|nr:gliding motility protein GldG [Myxococcaceae bacterium]
MERKARAAAESGILLLVIAGILIAVNALSALGMYKRVDTTKAERFTLSKGSGNLLRSMKQKMTVDAYVTKGLPKLDAFVRDLRDLLQEYKDASGGQFDYQIIEAKDEEQKKAAKDAGLVEQPFGEASDTEEKAAVTQGFMGIVFKYGAEKDAIKFLPPERTDGLEFWITNKVREIRDRGDEVKHKIGVLTGHDEMKLSEANLVPNQMGKPSMQEIITKNFPFYSLQDVDLKGGDTEIDNAIDGLIITQPNKDFTEKELRRIDQFVLKGKSLVIMASFVNVKASDATMNATLNAHGIEKLLEGYGVEMQKNVVLDFGRSFRVNVLTQGGVASARFPQFMDIQDDTRFTGDEQLLDTGFPGFFRIPSIVVPFASSLTLHADKQPGAKLHVVARSTPRTILAKGDTVDLKPLQQWKPKGEWGQFPVAATVEGKLKTAFPAGDKQGVETPAESTNPGRIFVVSSSQFLANPFARAGNGPDMGQFGGMMPAGGDEQLLQLAQPYAQQALTGTILSFKNTLDWLTGDTDLLAVSAKILSEPGLVYGDVSKPKFDENETDEQLKKRDAEMKEARKSQQHMVEIVLILGLPLLFALYGILRWRMRMSARENLSLAL